MIMLEFAGTLYDLLKWAFPPFTAAFPQRNTDYVNCNLLENHVLHPVFAIDDPKVNSEKH